MQSTPPHPPASTTPLSTTRSSATTATAGSPAAISAPRFCIAPIAWTWWRDRCAPSAPTGTPSATRMKTRPAATATSRAIRIIRSPTHGRRSRRRRVATFMFHGEAVTVIDNHFTSKGGSAPLLGSGQPPFDAGEVQRAAQAQAVNTFVDSLLASDANARVIVAGDLNEFQFEEPMQVLKGTATVTNYDVPGSDPFRSEERRVGKER